MVEGGVVLPSALTIRLQETADDCGALVVRNGAGVYMMNNSTIVIMS